MCALFITCLSCYVACRDCMKIECFGEICVQCSMFALVDSVTSVNEDGRSVVLHLIALGAIIFKLIGQHMICWCIILDLALLGLKSEVTTQGVHLFN